MTTLCNTLPVYEPKTNWELYVKEDKNIIELRKNYPNGCTCCGVDYKPNRYSTLISSHFKTQKHKKNVIDPANVTFNTDMKDANDINQAFEEKCKENRALKQLNYNYVCRIKKLEQELNNLISKEENLIDLRH
jgi:hypothetical protein